VVAVLELVAALAVHVVVRRSIEEKADATPLSYRDPSARGKKKPRKDAPPPMIQSTVHQYDLMVWGKEVTTTIVGALACAAIHVVFGSFTSLWIGAFTAPATTLESPLFRCHCLGAELARPFDEPPTATSAIRDDWRQIKKEFGEIGAAAGGAQEATTTAQRVEARLELERRRGAQGGRVTGDGGKPK